MNQHWILKASHAEAGYPFEMIAGKVLTVLPVFRGRSRDDVRALVTKSKRPRIQGSLPPHYKSLIKECWIKNPSDCSTFD
jgi:hypothetical protein